MQSDRTRALKKIKKLRHEMTVIANEEAALDRLMERAENKVFFRSLAEGRTHLAITR